MVEIFLGCVHTFSGVSRGRAGDGSKRPHGRKRSSSGPAGYFTLDRLALGYAIAGWYQCQCQSALSATRGQQHTNPPRSVLPSFHFELLTEELSTNQQIFRFVGGYLSRANRIY